MRIYRYKPFSVPCLFDSITDVREAVRKARDEAYKEARANTYGGVLTSRGAWIIVRGPGEPIVPDGVREFRGSHSQLDEELWDRETSLPKEATGIYIEGGFNWSQSIQDKWDNYEPWVSEWSITIWERTQ